MTRVELEGRTPSEWPSGEVVLTRLDDGRLYIDRADPRVAISAELIDGIADRPTESAFLDTAGCETYMGALLKIRGVNCEVVYRLVDWLPSVRAFIAEWPSG